MATTRTVTATADGPTRLNIEITVGSVTVVAEPGRTRAEATISNRTNDPNADAMVDNGTVQANGTDITIRTANPPANVVSGGHFGQGNVYNTGSGVMIVGSGVVIAGMVAGNVNFGNGVVVSGGGAVCGANALIEVTALVPEGSTLSVRTQGGDTITKGKLARVDAHANGGRIDIEHVDNVEAQANGGTVNLRHFTGHARIKANGGNVRAFGVEDAVLNATANGGNVVYGRNLDARVTANGGSVRTEKVT